MGLLPMRPSPLEVRMFRYFARHIHLVCISRGEQAFLQRLIPNQRIHYIPFGVDQNFWSPQSDSTSDYVFAIGNDKNRDWRTLISAWNEDLPRLKIVTSMPVPSAPPNVEVIRGDWRNQILGDEELRTLVRGARFVVVPLHDTIQPAGQSACLQAMACGKAVILSNIAGLWDRELMRDGVSVLLTPPENVTALSDNIRRLTVDQGMVERLGLSARRVICESLNVDNMAASLLHLGTSLSESD